MIPVTKIIKLLKFSSKAIVVTVVVFYIIDSGIGPKIGLYVLNRLLNVVQTMNKSIRRILIGDDSYIKIEIAEILDNDGCPLVISIPSSSKVSKVISKVSMVTNLFGKPLLTLIPLLTHLFHSDDNYHNDESLIRSIIRETQRRRHS